VVPRVGEPRNELLSCQSFNQFRQPWRSRSCLN
jgi:hypothetical protein